MNGSFSLAELARELGIDAPRVDASFSRVSTDTRTLQAGDLYIALKGERFDGNAFVAEAARRGAAAVIAQDLPEGFELPSLLIADSHLTLLRLARMNRRRCAAVLVALTGSQGKTSVKEMLGSIFKQQAATHVTSANFNNTIGVPLTLLDLERQHEFAVIEMGANGAGEIALSVGCAEPNIALITKASAAHIEGFGSLQGIVEAKGEIIDGLGQAGTAIFNANDKNCDQWIARAGKRKVCLFSYGEQVAEAAYRCTPAVLGANGKMTFRLRTPSGEVDLELGLLGAHNAENALAAAACAIEAGASLDSVRAGLAEAQPVPGRLFPSIGKAGCRLLDDTYNASPDSYKAAIDVLASAEGERLLVAGGMRELGEQTLAAHREVGEYAAKAGLPVLLAVGEECAELVAAYREAGGASACLFNDHEALAEECLKRVGAEAVFLVKGSRGARMDKIVAALTPEPS